MLGNSMMPVINKTARITKNTTATIDHIFINSFTTTKFKTGIYKIGYFGSFSNILCGRIQYSYKRNKETFTCKFSH